MMQMAVDLFGEPAAAVGSCKPAPVMLREFQELRPAGGFDFIMADPPWSYEMYSDAGYEKSPDAHYETMPLDQIMAMPVEVLAARDCLLWLWAVGPMLPQACNRHKQHPSAARLARLGRGSFDRERAFETSR